MYDDIQRRTNVGNQRARAFCRTDGRGRGRSVGLTRLAAYSRILPLSLLRVVLSCWALFGRRDICSLAAGAEAHNLPREAPPPPRRSRLRREMPS